MAKNENSNKPLMIILISLIIILMVSIGGIGYFLYSKGFFDETPQQKIEEKIKTKENEKKMSKFKGTLDNLVLNVVNTKGRIKLMKLSLSIQSINPNIEAQLEELKPELLNFIILKVSSTTSEELLTVGGKNLLKEQLIDELNVIFNEKNIKNEEYIKNSIKNVFFTTFVMK